MSRHTDYLERLHDKLRVKYGDNDDIVLEVRERLRQLQGGRFPPAAGAQGVPERAEPFIAAGRPSASPLVRPDGAACAGRTLN